MTPYSAENRPSIGSVLEGNVLMKKFDNAKHRDVWMITMNMNNVKEEAAEETVLARAIRHSGINTANH